MSSSACCSRLARRWSQVRDAAAVGADADEGDDDDDEDDDGDDDERSTDWMKCAKVRSKRAPAIWRGVNPPKVSALSAEYISCRNEEDESLNN